MSSIDVNPEFELVLEIYRNRIEGMASLISGQPPVVTHEELLQVGLIAFWEAWEAFDESKKVALWSFASSRVKGAMLSFKRNHDLQSRGHRVKTAVIKNFIQQFISEYGREPTREELMFGCNLSLVEMKHYDAIYKVCTDSPRMATRPPSVAPEEHSMELVDNRLNPEEELYQKEVMQIINRALVKAELDFFDGFIIYLRYHKNYSFKQIGDLCGLAESTIWKYHEDILNKLREHIKEDT